MEKPKQMNVVERIRKWYRNLPDKKRYLEFLSALLTIPVLITVILLNLGNLKQEKQSISPTPSQKVAQGSITGVQITAAPTPTALAQCKQTVGPVQITSPSEGEVLTQTPVCFTINYPDNSYCSVIWAYRIDGGAWSNYSSNSVCLYNLSNGNHSFELNVKSTVSSDQVNVVRNFVFQGPITPTPTPTINPSPTASP